MAAGAIAALLIAERRRPSRPSTQAEPRRTVRNIAMGAACMGVVAAVEKPIVERIARQVEARRIGLAQQLPAPVRDVAAFLLLDWAMYGWHVATHKVPLLWRFHLVHHVDLDVDASTALRFHASDMLISIPFRAAQVTLAGAGPRAHQAWQTFFFASVLFHHSRLRLPRAAERILSRIFTTPGMHDIHHRAERTATDSNWSSGLSLWDHLHGTFRTDQPDAPIGVPGYRKPAQTALLRSLAMPFERERDAWEPEPGSGLSRAHADHLTDTAGAGSRRCSASRFSR